MISKDQFASFVDAIRTQMNKDIENSRLLGKIYTNAFTANLLYDNSLIIDKLIEAVSLLSGGDRNVIEQFCYNTGYNKASYVMTTYQNDIEYNIATAEELYDFIMIGKERYPDNPYLRNSQDLPIYFKELLKAIYEITKIDYDTIIARNRTQIVHYIRVIIVGYYINTLSHSEIASLIKRDRTTVIYLYKVFKNEMDYNKNFRELREVILSKI